MKREKPNDNTFLIRIMGRQHATWQGTATLLGQKATRAVKLPQTPAGNAPGTMPNNAETVSFRSLLELIRLIDGALADDGDPDEG
jgi:hypothetical protein